MRMKAPTEGSFDPIAPLELPHSLHAFQRVSSSDELNMVWQSSLKSFYIIYVYYETDTYWLCLTYISCMNQVVVFFVFLFFFPAYQSGR